MAWAFHLSSFRLQRESSHLHYSLGMQPYIPTKDQKAATNHHNKNATKFFQNEFPRFVTADSLRESSSETHNTSLTTPFETKETAELHRNETHNKEQLKSTSKSNIPKNYEWPDPNRMLSSFNLQRKNETKKNEDTNALKELLPVGELLPLDGQEVLNKLTGFVSSFNNSSNLSSADALLSLLPPKEDEIEDAFVKASDALEKITVDSKKRAPNHETQSALPKIVNDKNAENYVTVKDLQSILTEILEQQKLQYQQQEQRRSPETAWVPTKTSRGLIEQSTIKGPSSTSTTPTSGVAFPQPSKLDLNALKKGNSVAGLLLGMILGISILPNLWLFGSIVGAVYGYNITPLDELNVASRIVTQLGRKIARASLSVYDSANTLFFMYKTGQLSYEYYQRYAALDQKFAIQDKIDAFNARFAEGKVKFDKWEKENEVGRRVLAGMRTLWLVEEQSRKKNSRIWRRGSRYRVVQLFYDAAYLLGRVLGNIWKTLTGKGGSEVKEFLRGIARWTDTEDESIGARLGAALWAAVAVSLTGALFSLSPLLLTFIALGCGYIWPTWPSEAADGVTAFWNDRRSRGLDVTESKLINIPPPPQLFSFFSIGKASGGKNKNVMHKDRYYFYKTPDGKRKYYRVGVPWPFWNIGNRRTTEKKRRRMFSSND
ncbi:hypothetical protein FisN_19Hh038 [Fistulifera solaris]|uniref:Uncharacterized protein n=1 Tax=Fistulifera solaris TaxID=1519565 RepID=A0A1Z5JZL2_FISSO|nr:hypothetical protein FisN_19Hh038 [Fistulifera solaris]|eukprot:GAX19464.1 hypothetical protein FisN_19Hh038 [Fistulifera solaris]